MSDWTHICGLIRLDAIVHEDCVEAIKKAFGSTWSYSDMVAENSLSSTGVPSGSEGSVQYSVKYVGEQNEYGGSLVCCNVSVWGDLRDHSDYKEIVNWLESSINKLFPVMWVRSAIVELDNDYTGQYVYYWSLSEEGFVEL